MFSEQQMCVFLFKKKKRKEKTSKNLLSNTQIEKECEEEKREWNYEAKESVSFESKAK